MMNTTASTYDISTGVPLTKESLQKIADQLGKVPNTWLLVSPSGAVWKGDPRTLLKVLVRHHPMVTSLQEPLL